MFRNKFIPLKAIEFLTLLSVPLLGFVFSLVILIIYTAHIFWLIILLLTSFWLFKLLRYTYYKTFEIKISKKDLFEVIDVLVQLENWEYGEIKDNLITLYATNLTKTSKHIIYIKYFSDKLWITNISNPESLFQLFQSSLATNIDLLLKQISWKLQGKNLPQKNKSRSIENESIDNLYKNKTSKWSIKYIVKRIVGYFYAFIFVLYFSNTDVQFDDNQLFIALLLLGLIIVVDIVITTAIYKKNQNLF